MLTADALLMLTTEFGTWSSDPNRPDYACRAYLEMAPRWQLVHDIKGGTIPIRQKRQFYLPKFEAETDADWIARVGMTFVMDHYATTLVEHVGLVFANPPKLGDDVPGRVRDLCEDIDGEGNHIDVFAQTAFDTALDLGHCVLFTDYPDATNVKFRSDETLGQIRPYVTLYRACDVMSWRWATVGGVKVLTQIVFRETATEEDGEFGTKDVTRFREITQAVTYDMITGRAIGLGAITWRAWVHSAVLASALAADTFADAGSGTIIGPTRICARVVYGGERTGFLQSKPHLIGLAFSNIEETQVTSDYASIMHKCNVPTPIFIGLQADEGKPAVRMGQGIIVPIGGNAKMLEPTGVAINATRMRIQDLQAQMRRQGATSGDESGKVMTAIEAKIYAKQRNAKLARAARSLQDALEGVFADIAAFLQLPDGGSITVNQNYADEGIDPIYLTVLVAAYKEGALPLDALLYALEKGSLPEDFSASDSALTLIAEEIARQDAADLAAKQLAANPPPVIAPAAVPPVAAVVPGTPPVAPVVAAAA